MTRFRLALGLHNHQPIGNFDHVFEEAHQQAYHPFLQLLTKYPNISLSLHQSGILWNWQEAHHPEYLAQVRQLAGEGRIELMTGGFYEPILTAIPTRDLHGQIGKLTDYLRTRFQSEATGLWLTERVWEPHLPKVLAQSGVRYLPVDDTHFLFAGLERSRLTGPFITEFEGETVILLPIQKKLRYLIPFGKVEEVITELKRQADISPDGVAVYADDGEKFGVWPNTHQHCYGDRWLADFFEALAQNADWLEVVPLQVAASLPPVGRVYLPSASYEEMGHWALPTEGFLKYEDFEHWLKSMHKGEEYERFVRAGHWRGFLTKYEESNLMQKKMLRVSLRLAAFESAHPEKSKEMAEIRDRLYASQCNCPYWHGVFGGLYLPHLRQAVYGAMVEADGMLSKLSNHRGISVTQADYDADGRLELLAETPLLSALIKPDRGGMLVDLALNRHQFDLTDTLSRRREGYHRKLATAAKGSQPGETASIHDMVVAKEPGLERLLVEDQYLKRCFVDHFIGEQVDVESFRSAAIAESGETLNGPYHLEGEPGKDRFGLHHTGSVRVHGSVHAVRVSKVYRFLEDQERIEVTYELQSSDGSSFQTRFAIENNFSFQAGHADDRYLLIDGQRPTESFLDSVGSHAQTRGIAMVDEWRGLAVMVRSQQPCDIWHHPLFTVSLSEAGFEKVYQGTTLIHCFSVMVSPEPTVIQLTLTAGAREAVLKGLEESTLAGNF